MASFVQLVASQRGEDLADWVGVTFLLAVWGGALLYADFSGVTDIVLATLSALG